LKAINLYLYFNNNCEEAFEFYRSVFGGEFQMVSRYKEAPEGSDTKANPEAIMHIALPLTDGNILMGSDSPSPDFKITTGNNFSISISTNNEEEADKLFNNLAKGGEVTMPLSKTFWNAYFGMCTDKFGVNWMVSYNYGQPN
jgi:PhnB protein